MNVNPHAGNVAYIVAHVIGYNSRVPGVVLGYDDFHFTNQAGTYIDRFDKYTAAYMGKTATSATLMP